MLLKKWREIQQTLSENIVSGNRIGKKVKALLIKIQQLAVQSLLICKHKLKRKPQLFLRQF